MLLNQIASVEKWICIPKPTLFTLIKIPNGKKTIDKLIHSQQCCEMVWPAKSYELFQFPLFSLVIQYNLQPSKTAEGNQNLVYCQIYHQLVQPHQQTVKVSMFHTSQQNPPIQMRPSWKTSIQYKRYGTS